MIDFTKLKISDYAPTPRHWACEICDRYSQLVWALVRGECLCGDCEAPYTYFPDGQNGELASYPHTMIKNEYLEAIRFVYREEGAALCFWELDEERIDEVARAISRGEINPV